jgi:ribosomal protein S18 acetylase RimI-like enzyme
VDWLTPHELRADPGASAVAEQVHRVVRAVAALGGAVGWLVPPDRDECDAWLDGVLASGARLCVARVDGRIEALGYWCRLPADVLNHNAEIRKVMVHPDARGLGLGRSVVEALIEDATTAGVESIILDARGNNHGAIALYQSLGFVEYGRLPDFIAVGRHRFDRVLMQLPVSLPPDAIRHGERAEGPGASLQTSQRPHGETTFRALSANTGS